MGKKLKSLLIIFFVESLFFAASDSVKIKQELVTAWVMPSDSFEKSKKVIEELQRDCIIHKVYRGTQNSVYVTLEFAENWVKNFKRM